MSNGILRLDFSVGGGNLSMVSRPAGQGTGPGTLVSYFTGKGLSRLQVPVVIVPGHLTLQEIDGLL